MDLKDLTRDGALVVVGGPVRRRAERLALLVAMHLSLGCHPGTTVTEDGGRDVGSDASASIDTGVPDVGRDSGPPGCLAHELTDRTCWTFFDLATVNGAARGFFDGVFDGRYLYLLPGTFGTVARLDTSSADGFASPSSWAFFDVSSVRAEAHGFTGGVFDGRFLYLVPNYNDAPDGLVVRLDTSSAAGFASASSWTFFDVSTLDPDARGFDASVFDGRYVYLVPGYARIVARLDVTAPSGIENASSWAFFDLAAVDADIQHGRGSTVFDGRYVYFAAAGLGATSDVLVRFDTSAVSGFADAASWTSFDVTNGFGFWLDITGQVFDGRSLYLTPGSGVVAQFDTTSAAGFADTASWATFDVGSAHALASNFGGGVFDGRHLFLVPFGDGIVAQFDTAAAGGFVDAASWSFFDLAGLRTGASGYSGGAFDGRFIYFVPSWNGAYTGLVARFDTGRSAIPDLPGWFAWGPSSAR